MYRVQLFLYKNTKLQKSKKIKNKKKRPQIEQGLNNCHRRAQSAIKTSSVTFCLLENTLASWKEKDE